MENHTTDNSEKKIKGKETPSPCHRDYYPYKLQQNSSLLRVI